MTQYSFVPGGGKSASVNGLPSGPMTYLILDRNGSNIHTLAHARPRPGGRPDDSTLRCLRPADPTDPGVCGGGLGTRRVSDWQLPLARLIPLLCTGAEGAIHIVFEGGQFRRQCCLLWLPGDHDCADIADERRRDEIALSKPSIDAAWRLYWRCFVEVGGCSVAVNLRSRVLLSP